MKINFVQTIIAAAISLLIAYGLYTFYDGENSLLLSGGGFLLLASTLIAAIGINLDQARTTTNIRVVSAVFFFIALISQLLFSFFNFSVPLYVLINGLLLLVFVLIVYSLYKTNQ
jgi:hypothetical protein